MVNKALLLGFVGKDPEQRNLPNGELVVTFSLATTEKYKKEQSKRITKINLEKSKNGTHQWGKQYHKKLLEMYYNRFNI